MAAKLTEDERSDIIGMIRAGRSCNAIAREAGRSTNTISRIAKDIGWTFAQVNAARAREQRAAYHAEVRANIAAKAAQRAQEILDEFNDTQPVVVGNGEYVEVRNLALDARGQKDRAQAAQLLARTVLDIARLDEKADEGQAKGLLERLVDGLDAVADAGS